MRNGRMGNGGRALGDLRDFEVFEVNPIVTDSKGSPDRKSDTLSQNILFLSDLSDFEVFEVNTIVTDSKGSPDRKTDSSAQTLSPFARRPRRLSRACRTRPRNET
jgi:hypothetical protein